MLARVTQAEQLAAQAAQWQAAGRADMAAQLYGAALEHDPSKFAIRMQLAECLATLGQVDPAAEHYLMVAQAYAARGRQQECLAICDRVLAIAPHAFVYMSVGPMVRRIGRQARPVCARAAEAHLAAGRQTDGLQMLRLGAELDPHNPEVRRQLARIYQARHMKREAVEALLDAGNLLLQAKRYDDYVEVAEQILGIEPRELDTLRDLPRVYLELRKPHEAVRTLAALTKVSPGDIIGYEILAQAFALIGRVDKSLQVLERLVEELGATGQGDKADAILNHARYWRPTDVGFMRSLKRMEIPRPATPAERPAAREGAPEGTVVLSIADLLVDEGSRRAPVPGSRDVQLTEAEGTLTLRLDDLIVEEMQLLADQRPAPGKPAPGAPPPPPARRDQPPARKGTGKPAGRTLTSPSTRRDVPLPKPAGAGRSGPASPPGRVAWRPEDAPADSTIALDTADLLEALTGEVPRSEVPSPRVEISLRSDRADETELLSTDGTFPGTGEGVAPTLAFQLPEPTEDETTTLPPSGGPAVPARPAAPSRSISELIYDDDDADTDTGVLTDAPRELDARRDAPRRFDARRDDEESDAETLLHMKPLTAEDIARALAKQAAKAQEPAPAPPPAAPFGEPPAPAGSSPSIPFPRFEHAAQPEPELDAPTIPPAGRARGGMGDDAPTMFVASMRSTSGPDEAPTMPPPSLRPPGGMGDEAPTMARISPLTAADIARALSQRSPTRPPPPASDEAATLPPPVAHASRSAEPDEPPPLLPPLPPSAVPEREDEDESTISVKALRPEDFLRGPGGGRGRG